MAAGGRAATPPLRRPADASGAGRWRWPRRRRGVQPGETGQGRRAGGDQRQGGGFGQPHLILALDGSARIVSAFGYAPKGIDVAELPGAAIADLAAEPDRARIDLAIAAGAGECVFTLLRAPDRSCALALRRGSDGRLIGVLRDATRQQAREADLEAAREEAEALNAGKSRFLANMSHELRTPLNAINGFSEIMVGELFGPLGDKRYQGYAQDILDSGQHLLNLINDILDMAKIEAGKLNLKLEPMHIEEVVEDSVRLMRNRADAAGLDLLVDIPKLPEVDGDYRALKQVLLNLLSNAIKFTPRAGKVTVKAALELGPQGERVRVGVQDTGIGISEKDLERLAKPFEQIENRLSKTTQGSGLGLALTKSLVEMHGGSLDMQSEPGKGTWVSFTLPVQQGIGAIPRSHAAA